MASGPSHIDPVTADEVLTVQFTHIKRGGYDTHEVDAFLDRIAFTLDAQSGHSPDRSMTADDIRAVQFGHAKRGGYDTAEVDNLLDRIVEVLAVGGAPAEPQTSYVEAPVADMAPEPIPIPEPEPPMPEPEPEPMPEPEPLPEPVAAVPEAVATTPPEADLVVGPRLHDPEGAARNLLAAAQIAADSLTADAQSYSAVTRSEADSYDRATRSEADEHAASVTTTAETQAAAIREVAADEARRVAEEARSELLVHIDALTATKVALERDNASLQANLDTERGRILLIIDEFRQMLVDTGGGVTDVAGGHDQPDMEAQPDIEAEVEAAFTDEPEAVVEAESEAIEETPIIDTAEQQGSDSGDAAAVASRSVFDLADDDSSDADTSADWIDEAPAPAPAPAPSGDATIFDIEADSTFDDSGAGERFFDELRQADSDADALGAPDEDTDAALSAFFEPEEEPENDARWRDRFGPGRG